MEKQQKILEMAKDICRVKLNCNDVCKPISACDALRYAERAVEAGYIKQSGWISVEERLPEKDTRVLVFSECGVEVFEYEGDDKWWADDGWVHTNTYGITHWQPLPEPPKMKGGEE